MSQNHFQPSLNHPDDDSLQDFPSQQEAINPKDTDPALGGALEAYPPQYEGAFPDIVNPGMFNGFMAPMEPFYPTPNFPFVNNLPNTNGGFEDNRTAHPNSADPMTGGPQYQNPYHHFHPQNNTGITEGHINPSLIPESSQPGAHHPPGWNPAQIVQHGYQPTSQGKKRNGHRCGLQPWENWDTEQATLAAQRAPSVQAGPQMAQLGPEFGQFVPAIQPNLPYYNDGRNPQAAKAVRSSIAQAQSLPGENHNTQARGLAPATPACQQHINSEDFALSSPEPSLGGAFNKSKKRPYSETEDLALLNDDSSPGGVIDKNKRRSFDDTAPNSCFPQVHPGNGHRRVKFNNTPQLQVFQKNSIINPTPANALRMHPQPGQGQLHFANRAQAHKAASSIPTKWDFVPPRSDSTMPHNLPSQTAYVHKLVAAIHNTSGAINKGLGPHQQKGSGLSIGGAKYTPMQIEARCWQLVFKTEQLHKHGPRIFQIYDESKMSLIHKSRMLTFGQRIGHMCDALAVSKARCEMVLKGESLETFIGTAMTTVSQAEKMKKTNDERWKAIGHVKEAYQGHAKAYQQSGLSIPAHSAGVGAPAALNAGGALGQENWQVAQQLAGISAPSAPEGGNAAPQAVYANPEYLTAENGTNMASDNDIAASDQMPTTVNPADLMLSHNPVQVSGPDYQPQPAVTTPSEATASSSTPTNAPVGKTPSLSPANTTPSSSNPTTPITPLPQPAQEDPNVKRRRAMASSRILAYTASIPQGPTNPYSHTEQAQSHPVYPVHANAQGYPSTMVMMQNGALCEVPLYTGYGPYGPPPMAGVGPRRY